jgi:hypothetical protein
MALASLALVILSTSSTGFAGAPLVASILYAGLVRRSGFQPNRPFSSAAVLCTPIILIVVMLGVLLDERASETVRGYIDTLILNKSSSTSAVERSSWNAAALQNFFDSFGFGVGLGTIRTSSFPIALLANVGIPGTAFYALFAATALFRQSKGRRTYEADAGLAARNACFALIIGDTLAAPTVEQGLLFYALAALACASPQDHLERVLLTPSELSGAKA